MALLRSSSWRSLIDISADIPRGTRTDSPRYPPPLAAMSTSPPSEPITLTTLGDSALSGPNKGRLTFTLAPPWLWLSIDAEEPMREMLTCCISFRLGDSTICISAADGADDRGGTAPFTLCRLDVLDRLPTTSALDVRESVLLPPKDLTPLPFTDELTGPSDRRGDTTICIFSGALFLGETTICIFSDLRGDTTICISLGFLDGPRDEVLDGVLDGVRDGVREVLREVGFEGFRELLPDVVCEGVRLGTRKEKFASSPPGSRSGLGRFSRRSERERRRGGPFLAPA